MQYEEYPEQNRTTCRSASHGYDWRMQMNQISTRFIKRVCATLPRAHSLMHDPFFVLAASGGGMLYVCNHALGSAFDRLPREEAPLGLKQFPLQVCFFNFRRRNNAASATVIYCSELGPIVNTALFGDLSMSPAESGNPEWMSASIKVCEQQ